MTRPIGELIAPIIANAVGVANLQEFLEHFDSPQARKAWILDWWEGGSITTDEAELLFQHNRLEAA
jgi:hypothetical protein